MSLSITGTLPASMREGSRPGDWAALLAISSLLCPIAAMEATGPGGSHIALAWDAARGLLSLSPGAAVDFEAFALLGTAPEIVFSLRARLNDGTLVQDVTVFRVGVLDADDTPPSGLRFAAGGSVAAGAIGAVIGTLAVTDPDTLPGAPFLFSVTAEDDWRFEVVDGTTPKLKEGISLGLDDMPLRPLLIEVSDGRQSAAFTLDLTVLSPDSPPPLPDPAVLAPGEQQGPVTLASAARAVVPGEAAAMLQAIGAPDPGGARLLSLAEGGAVLLPGTARRIDFTDGRLLLDPEGSTAAARAEALHQALFGGTAPDAAALGRHVAALEAGRGLADLAATLLPAAAPPTLDAAFVAGLFHGAAGREPAAEELAFHLARLGGGVTRAQVAVDVAATAGPEEDGGDGMLWVGLPPGRGAAGPAGPLVPPWAAQAPAGGAALPVLDLLFA